MNGVVERHFLLCPFCKNRMNLDTKKCSGCEAEPLYIVWEHETPELALISRRYDDTDIR